MKIISLACDVCKKYYRFQAKRHVKQTASGKSGEIHFSVDDTLEIFKNLTENQGGYKSIFDQPMLGYLKELHEEYQIKVCLYCFYEDMNGFNLSQATDNYAKEFLKNADWLKFGFHGRNCHLLYDTISAQEAADDYSTLIQELQRVCGGVAVVTRVVRLSGFQGSRESVLAMRDCTYGLKGLFTADDGRKSYYVEADFYSEKDVMIDGISYYHSDLRIENCSWNKIHLPDNRARYTIFTHEYYLLSKKIQIRLEKLLCACVKDGRSFSFFE